MRNVIRGIIFDYGGTLDTGGNHWGRVIWEAYERHHLPVTAQQYCEAYVYAERTLGSEPIIQCAENFRRTLEAKLKLQREYLISSEYTDGKAFPKDTCAALVDDLYQTACEQTRHSREVLLQLKERLPLVLVSNFYGNLAAVLSDYGLADLFGHVVESAAVGVRKPDPRIFMLGVEALGLSPQQVMVVGDSMKNDIRPARSIGCHTVWLKGQGWPIDADFKSVSQKSGIPNSLQQEEADHFITDLRELLTII
jgi:putative hydrolase of the HAD superfamily